MMSSLQRSQSETQKNLSLRAQVAVVISVLSFLPTIVLMFVLSVFYGGELGAFLSRFWMTLLAWLIFVGLLSAGIGYVLSGQLFLPLRRLTQDINELQRAVDRLVEASLESEDSDPQEISQLKTSFNRLLQQVRIEQTRRSSFMAALMHDLKTPLIAAGNILTVIQDGDYLSKEERVDLVVQLRRENQSLLALVQKMVDAYKFEREDVRLTRQNCHLDILIDLVVGRVRTLAEKGAIKISSKGKGQAKVDARELERALYNLISNAVRYAKHEIKIDVYPNMIRISDDGPGLPLPIEQLAQPFNEQPVDIAGQRYTAGTAGLGLFIARRILEAHGGRLVTESTSNKGTTLLAYLGQEPSG